MAVSNGRRILCALGGIEGPDVMIEAGLTALVLAAIVTWALTPAVIRLAGRLGAVDHPSARKIHRSPIPRIGGAAVCAGFVAGALVGAIRDGYLGALPHRHLYFVSMGVAVVAMFALGLVDDLRGLTFRSKFAVQILVACAIWFAGFRIENVANPWLGGSFELGALSLPMTVLWIVGVTNAINLIDGLDGLATGSALVTTSTVAAIAIYQGKPGVIILSLSLVGSLLGFLPYNFNPARIFLGDSGSMFLGFVLSVISIRGCQKGTTVVAVAAPLLLLGLPLLDTALAIVRRGWHLTRTGMGERNGVVYVLRNLHHLFLPDRGHLHHRLLDGGVSHKKAVLILYVAGALMASVALVDVLVKSLAVSLVMLGLIAGSFVAFTIVFHLRTAAARRRQDPPPPRVAPPPTTPAPAKPR